MIPFRPVAAVLLAGSLALGCGGGAKPSPSAPPTPAASSSAGDISLVDATVVVKDCPDSSKLDPNALERTLRKLAEGCSSVPGGLAQLSATLLPSGRIELAAADGMVPTCVLKNPLVHRLPLKSACHTEVRVEEKRAVR